MRFYLIQDKGEKMSEKKIKCQVCGMDKNFKSSVAQGGFHLPSSKLRQGRQIFADF
jgi:hypothetical protein